MKNQQKEQYETPSVEIIGLDNEDTVAMEGPCSTNQSAY